MTLALPKEFMLGNDELVQLVADHVSRREHIVGPCKRLVTIQMTQDPGGTIVATAIVRFEALSLESSVVAWLGDSIAATTREQADALEQSAAACESVGFRHLAEVLRSRSRAAREGKG